MEKFSHSPALRTEVAIYPEQLEEILKIASKSLCNLPKLSLLHLPRSYTEDSRQQINALDKVFWKWLERAWTHPSCSMLPQYSLPLAYRIPDCLKVLTAIFYNATDILHRPQDLPDTSIVAGPKNFELNPKLSSTAGLLACMELSQLVHASDGFSDMLADWAPGMSARWGMPHVKKGQTVSPAICLEDPETLLRHLISLLLYDTSYSEYKLYLDEYGSEATIGEILKAITPAFQDFLNISWGNCYDVQMLKEVKTDVGYCGPVAYLNIIGAGPHDHSTFFRLYGGQALKFYLRHKQHQDAKYRNIHPSLQYALLGEWQRPLTTITITQFPISFLQHPEKLHPLLNIAEKLVTMLFQTLPAGILAKYLPKSVCIEHRNLHANVGSPLLQSRDGNGVQTYIDESVGYLKESHDPDILAYYLRKAKDNPVVSAILFRTWEIKRKEVLSYNSLPKTLTEYLARRGICEADSAEQLIVGTVQTIIQAVIKIMGDAGRATQAATRKGLKGGWVDENHRHRSKRIRHKEVEVEKKSNMRKTAIWTKSRYESFRAISIYAHLIRGLDPVTGENSQVRVKCRLCGV